MTIATSEEEWDEHRVYADALVTPYPPTLDGLVTIADEVTIPVLVPLLDVHAHHPAFYLFGYERPGGGQR